MSLQEGGQVECLLNIVSQQMNVNTTQSYYPVLQKEDVMMQSRLPLLCHIFVHWKSSTGVTCILICLHLSIIGLFTLSLTSYEGSATWHGIAQYLFSCGTFGFTGGCVNYLAVTLFFKRIPGLCGSGYEILQVNLLIIQLLQKISIPLPERFCWFEPLMPLTLQCSFIFLMHIALSGEQSVSDAFPASPVPSYPLQLHPGAPDHLHILFKVLSSVNLVSSTDGLFREYQLLVFDPVVSIFFEKSLFQPELVFLFFMSPHCRQSLASTNYCSGKESIKIVGF